MGREGLRPLNHFLQRGKGRRSVNKGRDGHRPFGGHAGRDVEQDNCADEVWPLGGHLDGDEAAEGHAEQDDGTFHHRIEGPFNVVGEIGDGRRRAAWSIGVAVSRQIEGEQRCIEGQRDGIKGVGILPHAVEGDHLGWPVTPSQHAYMAQPIDRDVASSYG